MADAAAHPPSPWDLRGWMTCTAYRVPLAELPPEVASHGPAAPGLLTLGDDALCIAAMVHYAPGSTLTYQELMVALPLGRPWTREVAVAQIWVDSPQSLAGGRGMWGIPKDLASWSHGAVADEAGAPIASVRASVGRPLVPGRLPVRFATHQTWDGRDVRAPIAASARWRALRATWDFAADGPLGWLRGRAPLGSVALEDLRIRFGT